MITSPITDQVGPVWIYVLIAGQLAELGTAEDHPSPCRYESTHGPSWCAILSNITQLSGTYNVINRYGTVHHVCAPIQIELM